VESKKIKVGAPFDLCLAPRRRVSEANGDRRLAVLPVRIGKRRADGGVCTSGWNP